MARHIARPGFVCGLGLGLLFPNLSLWLFNTAPLEFRGRLIGGMSSAIFMGQFLSPLAIEPLTPRFSIQECFAFAGIISLLLAAFFIGYGWYLKKHAADLTAGVQLHP